MITLCMDTSSKFLVLALIEVNNLIKKFGDFRALDGVNMQMAATILL